MPPSHPPSKMLFLSGYLNILVLHSYRVGGLVGWNYVGNISNCYSTGSVSGSEEVGGLAGSSGGTIVSSFWDINTSGQTTSSGGTGMTTAEMKTENTFTTAGWDFATIWRMRCEGMNYPKLNWQVIPTADWVCPDGVDFADFAYFAEWWQTTGCDSSNNFCGGTDMDTSGTVDIFDLVDLPRIHKRHNSSATEWGKRMIGYMAQRKKSQ